MIVEYMIDGGRGEPRGEVSIQNQSSEQTISPTSMPSQTGAEAAASSGEPPGSTAPAEDPTKLLGAPGDVEPQQTQLKTNGERRTRMERERLQRLRQRRFRTTSK